MHVGFPTEMGCVLVYRYTKERNINKLHHNSMYGYENNRNSPGTPGQPPEMFRFKTLLHHCAMFRGKIPNFLSASPNCEGALKVLGVEQRGEATYESPTSQEEKRYSQSHCATWPLRLELSHAMKITLPYASLLWHHLGLQVLTELFKVKGACTIQFIILSVLQFLFLRLKLDDNVNVSGSIFRR